jgi:hypothetical protein
VHGSLCAAAKLLETSPDAVMPRLFDCWAPAAAYVAVYGTLRAGGINDIAALQPGIACVGRTR